MTASFEVATSGTHEAIDVTDRVLEAVGGASPGLALIHTQHTTVALLIGPSDEGMLDDFARVGRRWLDESGPFEHLEHDNANGEAHVLSAFGGTRILLPIDPDGPRLGRWQRILLLELDGPRTRTVEVDVYPLGPSA